MYTANQCFVQFYFDTEADLLSSAEWIFISLATILDALPSQIWKTLSQFS